MSNDQHNPYATPQPGSAAAPPTNIEPALQRKIEAIIKDAGQFWLAILICIVCSVLGSIIISPWYIVRLLQWSAIARDQPMLLAPDAPRGSLAKRFQSAKTKLIIGLCFGCMILLLMILLFAMSFAAVAAAR